MLIVKSDGESAQFYHKTVMSSDSDISMGIINRELMVFVHY